MRKTNHRFVAAIWLPVLLCILSLAQIASATHVHDGSIDFAPEASCSICIQTGQNDDLDLPTSLTLPLEQASFSWALPVPKTPFVTQALEAKARAPPHS